MNITVVYPARGHSAYKIAAEAFESLAKEVADASIKLLTDAEPLTEDGSVVVVIGTDAANHLAADLYLDRKIGNFEIRYNTDDYRIFTRTVDNRTYLFLAGGRPRATLYAVYRYFEKFCGCRWFWDGDRICHTELPMRDIDLTETPRFEYRGLRYFAHRSLHRFQAEHWSLEDWQKEIDWILKKRLNMFMLRIGLDDVFQKAFPDIVPYPELEKPLPEAGQGHHDRNLFWSLEYRGELRKKLLQYAFERDLMHPEDCGTITHWYSRTPKAYLEKVNPKLLLGSKYNGEATGQTWDILDDENLENYFKLTETHIKEYGKPELFHTIGLAERLFSTEREVNVRLKYYVYRRVSSYLKEKYPNAPLMIASWDLWNDSWSGRSYTAEDIQHLVSELDPSQSIILDYTSDCMTELNFTNWGIVGKFPWIFGMFGGYEPDNDIRGFYDWTNERIKIAKNDPMCKGVILWPELSHGDTLMTEYLARNAWEKDTLSIEQLLDTYCKDRYSNTKFSAMKKIWDAFMPIVRMRAWNPIEHVFMSTGQNTFFRMDERATFEDKEYPYYGRDPEDGAACQAQAVYILRSLAEIEPDDEMLRRDIYDIARSVLGRYVDCLIRLSEIQYINKNADMTASMEAAYKLLKALSDLLASHEDYSLYQSLLRLQSVTKTNPNFEITLKNNASGYYCRSYISENVEYLYLPEMEIIFDEVKKAFKADAEIDRESITARIQTNQERFDAMPLAEMSATELKAYPDVLREAANIIENATFINDK